jgi:acetyltransferase-like isoleucine patch superfamily enzyme
MLLRTALGKYNRRCRSALIAWLMRAYGVRLGSGLTSMSLPVIRLAPGAEISIGADVIFNNSIRDNPAGAVHAVVLAAMRNGAVLQVGDRVGISGAILYAESSVTIEDDVLIGAGARIFDTDFHPVNGRSRLLKDDLSVSRAPVLIRRGAWVGAGAYILKGVTIGQGAVVGAGAVVTRDVPENAVAAGNPAKVVRLL